MANDFDTLIPCKKKARMIHVYPFQIYVQWNLSCKTIEPHHICNSVAIIKYHYYFVHIGSCIQILTIIYNTIDHHWYLTILSLVSIMYKPCINHSLYIYIYILVSHNICILCINIHVHACHLASIVSQILAHHSSRWSEPWSTGASLVGWDPRVWRSSNEIPEITGDLDIFIYGDWKDMIVQQGSTDNIG